jgi:para-aminobenzoate synthetase/4-amino-4-deoxychorismate lyase
LYTAVFQSFRAGNEDWSGYFRFPVSSWFAYSDHEVLSVLHRAEQSALRGYWVVITVSYEAAPAFDSKLTVHSPTGFPLISVQVFDRKIASNQQSSASLRKYQQPQWFPKVTAEQYKQNVLSVLRQIAAGNTYQVNYSFPLHCEFSGSSFDWFQDLCSTQRAGFCAYVDLGHYQILSLSPELFFQRIGNKLLTRPMKGTMPRGRWLEEDEARAEELRTSEKNRAENIMIADLVRNDLGKISIPGSVRVGELWGVEKYDTLWQMTSTIASECGSAVQLTDIFRALFPCGSITGAPKVRTMEIINEIENCPRDIYTGAIGLLRPGGDCIFNVAIRTVLLDTRTRSATFGIGSGVTADSSPDIEFEEIILKTSFLDLRRPEFRLIESLLLENGKYFLLERHLVRIAASAKYFDYSWNEAAAGLVLEKIRTSHETGSWKVRLLVARDGNIQVEVELLSSRVCLFPQVSINRRDSENAEVTRNCDEDSSQSVMRLHLARVPIDSNDRFLFHKTTNREVYNKALLSQPNSDDLILWNEKGEVTESTIANIVVEIDGLKYTPPRESGLLAGIFREELLAAGEIEERVIYKQELWQARSFWLINSVRKWMPAVLCKQDVSL